MRHAAQREAMKAAIGLFALALISLAGFSQQSGSGTSAHTHSKWVLPVADGGDVSPSAPSIRGYLVAAGKRTITVKSDRRATAGSNFQAQLTRSTQFFTVWGRLRFQIGR